MKFVVGDLFNAVSYYDFYNIFFSGQNLNLSNSSNEYIVYYNIAIIINVMTRLIGIE